MLRLRFFTQLVGSGGSKIMKVVCDRRMCSTLGVYSRMYTEACTCFFSWGVLHAKRTVVVFSSVLPKVVAAADGVLVVIVVVLAVVLIVVVAIVVGSSGDSSSSSSSSSI